MEAKATAMKDINKICPMSHDDKVKCVFVKNGCEYGEPWGIFDRTRRMSAEISFKAGFAEGYDKAQDIILEMGDRDILERGWKSGIKEVVDWMGGWIDIEDDSAFIIPTGAALKKIINHKLREWGL